MSTCAALNCGYYWKEEDEAYARCHFEGPEGLAPCEQEDFYYEDDVDESGFDPYEGCYTFDC